MRKPTKIAIWTGMGSDVWACFDTHPEFAEVRKVASVLTWPLPPNIDEVIAERDRLREVLRDTLQAAKLALSAIDSIMGDTDLPDDDSPEFLACQALSRAIVNAERCDAIWRESTP